MEQPLHLIFYTDFGLGEFDGKVNAFFVRIRPSCRDDVGLLAHELEHVKQFWKMPILHSFLYQLNSKYRLKCELEAYKVQMDAPNGISIDRASDRISTCYKLDITKEEAKKLLEEM